MTITPSHFSHYIIEPALDWCLQLGAVPAPPFMDTLMLATAAIETGIGRWLHQVRGPALGVFQVEPATLDDLLTNYIKPAKRFNRLMQAVSLPSAAPHDQIIFDLRYAAVITRLYYYRVKEPLPPETTFDTLWHYYKTYYNTAAGKADEGDFARALALANIHV